MEHLLTVEDTFLIEHRGLVVVPAPTVDEFPNTCDLEAELRLPNGSRRAAVVSLLHEFLVPAPQVRRYCCVVRGASKSDVPIGTEIWYTGECAA